MIDFNKPFMNWRDAVIDVRQLIDYAATRPELKTDRGVSLVGYSLGTWISSIVGPCDPRVKELVLMVGGAWDLPPNLANNPRAAATDPRQSLPHFAGKPVLLLNGKNDTIVRPDLARRLFKAAAEPKEQIWYDSGHLLPAEAYEKAAQWLAKTQEHEPDRTPEGTAHSSKP